MLGDITKRRCDYCGARYRPRHPDQRYCRRWCRLKAQGAEARSARRVWIEAGRPMQPERPVQEPERHEVRKRGVAA
jgi:hypothetical protein